MTFKVWKNRYDMLKVEADKKEREIQELTKNLVNIVNSASAMNNEIKKWIEIAEGLEIQVNDIARYANIKTRDV